MNLFNYSGIKRKVLIAAVLPAATVTLLLALFFSINQAKDLQESLQERGLVIIRQLSPASEYGVYSGNPGFLRPLIDALMQEADVRSVVIRNKDGKTLIRSGPEAMLVSALDPGARQSLALSSDNGRSWIFQTPIYQTELPVGDRFNDDRFYYEFDNPQLQTTDRILGWVSVELSNERTLAYQTELQINTAIIATFILLVGAVLAIRLGRSISDPILTLKQAVDDIERGNLDIELNSGGSDELLTLETGINSMAKTLKNYHANLADQIQKATDKSRNALKIVEQRNAELESARKEAESSNKAKSTFLANISHEIRTPLNGIQGFHMLLAKTGLDAVQRDYVEKIETSTRTLLSLLNDLLDLSKLEVAQLSIIESPFNLRELLDESIYLGLPEAQSKELEVIVIVDPEIPGLLYGAADRIAQVIKNLVSNAVKFTARGEVIVRAGCLQTSGRNITIELSVSDTGIGIQQEDLEKLFVPFAQIETGRNRRYGGTGLGLAITKSLVELMHGEVSASSEPGKGSCFTITLPLTVDSSSPRSDRNYETILIDKRVLIVSPNEHIAESMGSSLKHWKMHPLVADNAASAISLLRSSVGDDKHFDALIIDAMLISNDIRKILSTVRKLSAKAPVRLILLDRADSHSRTDMALHQSFNVVLPRPARFESLVYSLDKLLGESSTGTELNATPDIHLKSMRVLLADDNAINRQFFSTWLQQIGARVDEVAEGMEAIACCQQVHYDLILMDLHMPNIDGFEAAARIRESGINNIKTPIIAVTADASEKTGRKIRKSALDDILIKPFTEEQLLSIVETWCPTYLPAERVERLPEESFEPGRRNSIVDQGLGLKLASGNLELWRDSLQTLVARLATDQSDLERAINGNDLAQVQQLAHRIVGAAGYCAAIDLHKFATQLELAAGNRDIVAVQAVFLQLCGAISQLSTWSPDE